MKPAAERSLGMIRGGLLREYKLLPSPECRLEYLAMLRKIVRELELEAGEELYRKSKEERK